MWPDCDHKPYFYVIIQAAKNVLHKSAPIFRACEVIGMRANLKFISALPRNADAIKVPAAVGSRRLGRVSIADG